MKTPLFPGESDLDQLDKIFQLFGTPTEVIWPVRKLCYVCVRELILHLNLCKFNSTSPPIYNIWVKLTVWRIRGKIFRVFYT